ncbi:MAG: glycosyltransferase family 4 protein [Bacteroidales bacterium]|jgi:glycosyltransferase involved in cell wall biosynthesis|nr:glycosyltransferase family 4 protein [Bacteroidales bacterium]
MKILQICYKPPFPPADGGAMGMNGVTEGLINTGNSVKVLTFYSDKHPFHLDDLPKHYIEQTNIEAIFVDLGVKLLPAFECWITGESYHVKRFVSKDMAKKIKTVLQQETDFDVVQMESIFLSPYVDVVRKYSKARLVLHAPNVEHLIWQRIAKTTKNIFKKHYLKHLALTLRAYELENINRYDAIYPATTADAEYFKNNGCRRPCIAVPVGLPQPDIVSNVLPLANTLFHIGSMNYVPNLQAIEWFLQSVWQDVLSLTPNAKLYLAGRDMPPWLLDYKAPNVEIVGEVADSTLFMQRHSVMVVPLLSGSGVRIKIIEAMSLGKCVIATAVAAEGIPYSNNENIIIANTAEEFAKAVAKCFSDKEFCDNIGINAAKLVAENYNINAIAQKLVSLYQQIEPK